MASLFDGFQSRATTIVLRDQLTSGATKEFAIDVTKAINTTMSASVTEFPIEGGGSISDHIQVDPLEISLECFVSESPSQQLLTLASGLAGAIANQVGQFQGLSSTFASAAASAAVGAGGRLISAFGGRGGGADYIKLLTDRQEVDPTFPKRCMKGLINLFENQTPFTIRTFFTADIYQNMVITGLDFNQSPVDGDSISFTMNCRKLTIVEAFSRLPSEIRAADPAGSSAAAALSLGSKDTKEATPEQRSNLYKNFPPEGS